MLPNRGNYLVGADGARCAVRRGLDIRFTGETGVVRDFFGGKMIAVYLRVPDFYKVVSHEPAWMYWAFNATRRSWLAAVNGKDEFAFHTQLKPGEDENNVSPQRVRGLFRQVTAMPLELEVLAVDTWIAGHALVAESLGRDRVFIGGDAAHLFAPADGLGYNTAIEDAVNLGWKLAAAVHGTAGPGSSEVMPTSAGSSQSATRAMHGSSPSRSARSFLRPILKATHQRARRRPRTSTRMRDVDSTFLWLPLAADTTARR